MGNPFFWMWAMDRNNGGGYGGGGYGPAYGQPGYVPVAPVYNPIVSIISWVIFLAVMGLIIWVAIKLFPRRNRFYN